MLSPPFLLALAVAGSCAEATSIAICQTRMIRASEPGEPRIDKLREKWGELVMRKRGDGGEVGAESRLFPRQNDFVIAREYILVLT